LSSPARCCQVVDEVSVDDIEQSAFEAAQRFEVVLPWSQVHAWEPGTGGAADGVNRVLPEVLSRAGCPAGTTGRWRWRFP
jgi:hypothetical protein